MKINKDNLSSLDDDDIFNIIVALSYYIETLSIDSVIKEYQELLDKLEERKTDL